MKEFNTIGVCNPRKHYMVDISNKLDQIEKLVERGRYFTINRPRQYGKTTTMFLLKKRLCKKNYLVIRLSFERIGDKIFNDEELFSRRFIKYLIDRLEVKEKNKEAEILKNKINDICDLYTMSEAITEFVHQVEKPVVLLIDEVDKSSNNQLFLSFLGFLRDKFLLREQDEDYTFHSVVLAGVYDVKNLKLKLRPDDERKYNSPWNIAVDFNVEMDFNPQEIATMLREYQQAIGVEMDINNIAEKIYYYTSGYPYLVSKLCKIINKKILPKKEEKKWSEEDVEKAVSYFIN